MLSSKAKYGLKAMLHLAEHGKELPVLISDVAASQQIPKKFLDIILLELKNGGLLQSKKGKGGGYQLAREAGRITVGQIVRLLDGPLAPIACASRTAFRPCDDCRDVERCRVRLAMLEVRDAIAEVLDHMSLADLAGARGSAEAVLLYDI
jgi:Rrf2 family protein